MISMLLSEAAKTVGSSLDGEDVVFCGCSTDSRTIEKGNLFIALKGDYFDGHQYISVAEKKVLGVRVSVKSGGCAGMSYVMEYSKEINPNDEVIEDKGVKVFIDSAAVMYLLGTEMDYKKEKFSSQFVFKNPNETERCGCGESFKV